MKIKDIHCDLLEYLQQSPSNTPYDQAPRCSVTDLLKGEVVEQVAAVFTETKAGSHFSGRRQVQAYKTLKDLAESVQWRIAIENASGFIEEEEGLKEGLSRIARWHKEVGPFVYMSLTWNQKNRFGGGTADPFPLTDDGEEMILFLQEHNIALDLAHASDPLAESAIDFIEKKGLSLPVLYSHGQVRSICDVPRNAPDWLLSYVIERQGLIGLSFVAKFIGQSPERFADHVTALVDKGGKDAICFGADFFFEGSIPEQLRKEDPYFFSEWDNAQCYPKVVNLLEKVLDPLTLRGLCSENVERFFELIDKRAK